MQATQAQRGQGAVFHIEIYADSTCPWCYIGTRFLNIAKATLPGAVFRLRWKPYQIAPDIVEEGEGMRELMESRYGKAIDLDDPNSPLAKAAVAAGVTLTSGAGIPGNSEASTCGSGFLSRRVWNSTASHKIIQAAGKQEVQKPGLQTAVVEAIFEAYFKHDANIADEQVLVSLAAQAGMVNAQDALRSSKLADRVANFKEAAAVKGVEAAPFFFISRQGYPGCYRLSGAQPAQVFIRAFESLLIDREQLVRMLRAKQQGDRSHANSPSSASSAKPAETSTEATAGEHTRTIRGAGYCSSAPPLSSSSDCSEPLPGRSRKRSRTDMFGTDVSRSSGDGSAEDTDASADSDIHAAAAALLSARHVSSPTAAERASGAAPAPQKARTLPQQAWSDGESSQASTVSSSAARSPFPVGNDTSTGSVRPCAYFSQGMPAAASAAAAAQQRQAGRTAMLSGSRCGQQRDARLYQHAAPFEQPRYAVAAAAAAAAPVQPHQRAQQQQHVIHYMSADVSTSAASSAPYAVTLVPVTRCGGGTLLAPLRGYVGGNYGRRQQQQQQAWLPQHPHGFAPRTWPQYAADRRVQADL
eukprot:TRINITY_DN137_c1_g1_i3.p1 TRINITY_DN137_c1_g1~~TRINITY_DN137_c1_g1_i3.p1  ORF type:complete len:584 (-),score=179.28 TRINITY_DN137_c1_g1_i3:473-2224(-)